MRTNWYSATTDNIVLITAIAALWAGDET